MARRQQSRKLCWFCGRPGASREHILARWIAHALDPGIPGGVVRYRHYSENPHAGIGGTVKLASGPAYYSRSFCRTCNSGWMAGLEEQVRPVLEPLMRGHPRLLAPEDQRLLALWATKTVLAFQTIEHETTRFADRALYGELYQLQAPLPCTQVWLGVNLHGHPAWHRSHSIVLREASSDGSRFGATLTVGHAVFHLVALPGVEGRLRLRGEPDLALREIWPGAGRALAWPPSVVLREHDLTALAEVIAQTSVLRAERAA